MAFYGAGDFGLNLYWQGVGFFLLFYYTDIIGLPNTLAGFVYAIGGLVDAFTDPTVGVIADRTKTARGRYRPYLLYGAAPLGLAYIGLFALPLAAPAPFIAASAVASHVVFRICYTAVSIPYGALGARLTFSARERSVLAGVRMLFGALGGVAIVALASALRANFSDGVALIAAAFLAGVAGAGLIVLCYLRTQEKRVWDARAAPARTYPLPDFAGLVVANRPFIILLCAVFLLTVANMIVIKTVIYRFEYILAAPGAGGMAMTVITATPLISIPLWIFAYLKFDKRPSFLLGFGTVLVGLIALYAVGGVSIALSLLAYGVIAFGFSAFAVGFWSALPDTIDYGHWKTGQRVESGLIGFASAIQKIAIALSGFCVGVVLDMFGYAAGGEQSRATLTSLHQFTTLAPAALMLAAMMSFSFYALSTRQHSQIIKDLRRR